MTTLLAVDDSTTMRKVLEMTFGGEDFRMVVAGGAQEALGKVRSEQPQVALIDAGLEGTNGYDLCRQIKQEAPNTRVILLTSKHQPYDRTRGASVGSDDFIDKPFDTQQLIDKVGAVAQKAAVMPVRPATPTVAQPGPATAAARPRAQTLSYGTPGPAQPPAPVAPLPAAPPVRRVTPQPMARPAAAPARPAVVPAAQPAPVARPPVQQRVPAQPPAAPMPAVAPVAVSPLARPAPSPAAPAVRPAVAAAAARPAPPAAAVAAAPVAAAAVTAGDGQFAERLRGLGLTKDQVDGVLALSREVVERVVWEVVPTLAETLIKEEIVRLTRE
ncbi:MAG TPA: response regulator [Polyangiaceae bacterium]